MAKNCHPLKKTRIEFARIGYLQQVKATLRQIRKLPQKDRLLALDLTAIAARAKFVWLDDETRAEAQRLVCSSPLWTS